MIWKIAFLVLLALVSPVLAQTPQTHFTVPGSNATFIPDLQQYLREEDPARLKDFFGGVYTISGGTHGTGAGLTKTPTALLAYPGGYYATESGSIVYQDNATCWVVATYATTSTLTGNFVRVGGTKYAIDCVSVGQPAQPANSVYLMKVVTAAGAVTTVTDLRQFTPFAVPGTLTGLGSLSLTATANGVTIFTEKRFTDVAPTGNFQDLQNAAGTSLWKIDVTGSLVAGTIATANTGPHAIGGATQASAGTRFTGALGGSFQYGVNLDHTISPAANAEAANLLVGGTLNRAGSGTHNQFNGARFLIPAIGAGAATLTATATVKIDGTPTVGTNKYALHDAGNARFDEGVGIGSGTTALGSGLIVGAVADQGSGTINVAKGYHILNTFAFRGYLAGLQLANNVGAPNTTTDIATGVAASDDATTYMALAAMSKTTASWALGTGNGCLDTGVVAAGTWYHVFVIMRVDTNVVDVLCSTSVSAPTFPTSYTKKRRIGSIKTDGAANLILFKQKGDWVDWIAPVLDVNNAASGTTANTATLTVPPGVFVVARGAVVHTSGATAIYVSALDTTDIAASLSGAAFTGHNSAAGSNGGTTYMCRTNTSAQLRYRATTNAQVYMTTYGWIDTRGKDD